MCSCFKWNSVAVLVSKRVSKILDTSVIAGLHLES